MPWYATVSGMCSNVKQKYVCSFVGWYVEHHSRSRSSASGLWNLYVLQHRGQRIGRDLMRIRFDLIPWRVHKYSINNIYRTYNKEKINCTSRTESNQIIRILYSLTMALIRHRLVCSVWTETWNHHWIDFDPVKLWFFLAFHINHQLIPLYSTHTFISRPCQCGWYSAWLGGGNVGWTPWVSAAVCFLARRLVALPHGPCIKNTQQMMICWWDEKCWWNTTWHPTSILCIENETSFDSTWFNYFWWAMLPTAAAAIACCTCKCNWVWQWSAQKTDSLYLW